MIISPATTTMTSSATGTRLLEVAKWKTRMVVFRALRLADRRLMSAVAQPTLLLAAVRQAEAPACSVRPVVRPAVREELVAAVLEVVQGLVVEPVLVPVVADRVPELDQVLGKGRMLAAALVVVLVPVVVPALELGPAAAELLDSTKKTSRVAKLGSLKTSSSGSILVTAMNSTTSNLK